MRRILSALAVAGILLSTLCFGQTLAQKQLLAQQQKQEIKNLKLKEKSQREAMKNLDLSKAMRIQLKHQMAREERELKQRQKDERQKLKDQERVFKQESKDLPSD